MFRIPLFVTATLAALSLAQSATAQIHPNAEQVQPVLSGMQAPSFSATAADGSTYSFTADARDKPAIITFYRGGWCPYCNAHLMEMRHIEQDLIDMGYELIFLSADRPELMAEAVSEDTSLPYTLLSDASMEVSQKFGIAFRVDDETFDKYKNQYGLDLEEKSGYDHHALPAPAVFIVDAGGTVVFQYVNPDYSVRISPEVLVAAAKTMPGRKLARN